MPPNTAVTQVVTSTGQAFTPNYDHCQPAGVDCVVLMEATSCPIDLPDTTAVGPIKIAFYLDHVVASSVPTFNPPTGGSVRWANTNVVPTWQTAANTIDQVDFSTLDGLNWVGRF